MIAEQISCDRVGNASVSDPETSNAEVLDGPGFTCLVRAVLPSLHGYARRLSAGSEIAEDLVQDTLVRAWAARARFKVGSNFKAWLFTILKRVFLTAIQRKRFKMEVSIEGAIELASVAPDGDAAILARECEQAVRLLPKSQREALFMIVRDGLDYESAAEILGVPVGTLKSRVGRARTAIAGHLERGAQPPSRKELPTSHRERRPGRYRGLIGVSAS